VLLLLDTAAAAATAAAFAAITAGFKTGAALIVAADW